MSNLQPSTQSARTTGLTGIIQIKEVTDITMITNITNITKFTSVAGLQSSLWSSMDGYVWMCMEIYGILYSRMEQHAHLWTGMDGYERARRGMEVYGILCLPWRGLAKQKMCSKILTLKS